jgi:hypothetical protein
MSNDMFVVLTDQNSAILNLNNQITGKQETLLVMNEQKSINYAIFCFAYRENVPVWAVGYSIKLPEESM